MAETVGLGASALPWVFVAFATETQAGILATAAVVVIGSTPLEGSVVGLGQWLVALVILIQCVTGLAS